MKWSAHWPASKGKMFSIKGEKNNALKDWNTDTAKAGNNSLHIVIGKENKYESQSTCQLR